MIKMTELPHAKLSPSQSYRWMNCAGSLCKPVKNNSYSGIAAFEGNMMHTVAEHCLNNHVNPYSCVGTLVGYKKTGAMPFTKYMASLIYQYVSYCRSINHTECFIEQQVNLSKVSLVLEDCWGTIDYLCISEDTISNNGDTVHIIDLKTGFVRVDAMYNTQLMLYGIGALMFLKEKGYENIKYVNATVVQPKKGGIKTHCLDLKALRLFARKVIGSVKLGIECIDEDVSDVDIERFNPGHYCKYCKILPICPAM